MSKFDFEWVIKNDLVYINVLYDINLDQFLKMVADITNLAYETVSRRIGIVFVHFSNRCYFSSLSSLRILKVVKTIVKDGR